MACLAAMRLQPLLEMRADAVDVRDQAAVDELVITHSAARQASRLPP